MKLNCIDEYAAQTQPVDSKLLAKVKTRTLIGGGMYIHIFMFYPTSSFQIEFRLINLKKNQVARINKPNFEQCK